MRDPPTFSFRFHNVVNVSFVFSHFINACFFSFFFPTSKEGGAVHVLTVDVSLANMPRVGAKATRWHY